jgi:hypothetical protein
MLSKLRRSEGSLSLYLLEREVFFELMMMRDGAGIFLHSLACLLLLLLLLLFVQTSASGP